MKQLSLFETGEYYEFPENLLEYRENFLTLEEANQLQHLLLCATPWKQKDQKMYSKSVLTPRLTAWYGDEKKSIQTGWKRV